MAGLGTIFSGLKLAETSISKVLSKKGTRINNKILAVSAMQRAINATEIYLTNSNHNYQPNENLSNLWLEAFTAMIKIDKSLAGRLREKSKFWSNPQRWLREESAMELVPDLRELNERCDLILVELERRK
ncbi:MAG: hypothetical protein ACX93I_01945 [Winogradskyella sp.]|jgi:hypothetical protein